MHGTERCPQYVTLRDRWAGRREGKRQARPRTPKAKPRRRACVCPAVPVSVTVLPPMLRIPANLSPQGASPFFLLRVKTDSYFYVIKQRTRLRELHCQISIPANSRVAFKAELTDQVHRIESRSKQQYLKMFRIQQSWQSQWKKRMTCSIKSIRDGIGYLTKYLGSPLKKNDPMT